MEIWEVYPEVYHYTKFSTALLIIHSATLRATRFDLLGDTQEIVYAKEIFEAKLFEKLDGDSVEKNRGYVEILYEAFGKGFYITSFCGKNSNTVPFHKDNGLLSMWRHYGADGGCAILFNTNNIYEKTISTWRELDIPPAIVMDKVIYQGENEDQEYNDRLDRLVRNALELINETTDNKLDTAEKTIKDAFCHMMLSKHPAFFQEREIRLGLCFISNQEKEIHLLPPKQFHEIPFSPTQDILRIIIGPHKDQQERSDFLKSYLSKSNLNIDVTMSEIPLRF